MKLILWNKPFESTIQGLNEFTESLELLLKYENLTQVFRIILDNESSASEDVVEK